MSITELHPVSRNTIMPRRSSTSSAVGILFICDFVVFPSYASIRVPLGEVSFVSKTLKLLSMVIVHNAQPPVPAL